MRRHARIWSSCRTRESSPVLLVPSAKHALGSCQPLPPIMGPPGTGQDSGCDIDYGGSHQSWIERTRYSVPGSQREVLLYRNNHSKETAYFCFSTRADTKEQWSKPAPSGFPDSTSNMNAGTLPDGRIFVLSNPSTRATLAMSSCRCLMTATISAKPTILRHATELRSATQHNRTVASAGIQIQALVTAYAIRKVWWSRSWARCLSSLQ